MIKKFKTSEKVVRIIELENTLVVEVGLRDPKDKIKKEFQELFKVNVARINTLIKDGKKYAYIKLNEKTPAIDVATKMGLI